MPKLPVISGKKAFKVFVKIGYEVDHQTGSHIILRHRGKPHRRLTVPAHRELTRGTLRKLIKQAGLTVGEFITLL